MKKEIKMMDLELNNIRFQILITKIGIIVLGALYIIRDIFHPSWLK